MWSKWLARAQAGARDIPVGLVPAKRDFEGWFLAVAEPLAGWRGLLSTSLKSLSDPESIRGAKERLSDQMPNNQIYSPTRHQAALVATMDLDLAEQRSRSFAKCKREIERLLKELTEDAP